MNSTGISGYSGDPATGGATCVACHSGGTRPTTTIIGPNLVASGNTVSYTLVISGGQMIAGGLDVSVTGGTLIATDSGTYILSSEVTHTQPRDADLNGDVTFVFDWTAPGTAGAHTIYAAGNSVDKNRSNSGDLSDKVRFKVTVQDSTVHFTPYGTGLAGSGGLVPDLSGTDGPSDGQYTISFAQGLGGAFGLLIYGFAPANLPFFGGSLLVDISTGFNYVPVSLSGPAGVPGAGALDINGVDVRDYLGISFFMQGAFFDPGAVRGVSLSNGLEMAVQ